MHNGKISYKMMGSFLRAIMDIYEKISSIMTADTLIVGELKYCKELQIQKPENYINKNDDN